MTVDLDKFLDQAVCFESAPKKIRNCFRPHFEYALFSFNKEMFGWVHYEWFECNHPLDPVEYDSEMVKGFQILNEGNMENYECEKELAEAQKNYDLYGEGSTGWGVDWKFMDNVVKVPVRIVLFEERFV